MAQGAGAPYDFHTKFSVPSNALSTDLQFKYDRPDPPTQRFLTFLNRDLLLQRSNM